MQSKQRIVHLNNIVYICTCGLPTQLEILLSDPSVDPCVANGEPLRQAAQYGHIKLIEILLKDPRVNPSVLENKALRYAAQSGQLASVQLLLSNITNSLGIDEALRFAVENGHIDIVRLLLNHPDINPDANNGIALILAFANERYEIVTILLADDRVTMYSRDLRQIFSMITELVSKGKWNFFHMLLQNPKVTTMLELNGELQGAILDDYYLMLKMGKN